MAACFPQSAETLQCSAAPPKFEVEFPSCTEDSTTVGPTTVTTELPTTLISTDKSTTLHSTLTSMSTTEREITSTVATEITSTVATEITSTVATVFTEPFSEDTTTASTPGTNNTLAISLGVTIPVVAIILIVIAITLWKNKHREDNSSTDNIKEDPYCADYDNGVYNPTSPDDKEDMLRQESHISQVPLVGQDETDSKNVAGSKGREAWDQKEPPDKDSSPAKSTEMPGDKNLNVRTTEL